MNNLTIHGFNTLENSELNEINGGGISLGTALLVIGGGVVILGAVGFVGGCIYEAILG